MELKPSLILQFLQPYSFLEYYNHEFLLHFSYWFQWGKDFTLTLAHISQSERGKILKKTRDWCKWVRGVRTDSIWLKRGWMILQTIIQLSKVYFPNQYESVAFAILVRHTYECQEKKMTDCDLEISPHAASSLWCYRCCDWICTMRQVLIPTAKEGRKGLSFCDSSWLAN